MFVLAPKMGSPAYQKAAEVFCELYAAVTGKTLAVKLEPSDTEDMVVIGTDAVQSFGFAKVDGGFPVRNGTDDYCIISQVENGRNLLFLGGGRGRSTLYAVYDFFERRAECHYFWDGDVIPHRDTIDICGLYVVESPRFEYRAIRYFAHRGLTRFQAEHWDWEQWKQEIDWVVKARLNTFMLRIGMDDLFQKAFPDIVNYPPEDQKQPDAGEGYNNRTTAWSLQYRGQLRKKVLSYAFDCDLLHPEDFGTMTHWYSRTPTEFLEKVQPKLMSQQSTTYSEQTGQVWDIFDDKNVENYIKLTETHVQEYGRPDMFHTIGLAERKFSDDPKKNIELKKFAYKRFLSYFHDKYPNAKVLIAAWDFFFRLNPEEVKEIVKLFDPKNTLILDYTIDLKHDASSMDNWDIMGKFPWIFGIFHGYMPQSHTHGDYAYLNEKIAQADADPFCKGMDFWPEMSHSDTLMLEYFSRNAWRPDGRSLPEVTRQLCHNRYGANEEEMWAVWSAFLPLINLSTIHQTSCAFNLLKHAILQQLIDFDAENREKTISGWEKIIAEQKAFDGQITALLEQVKALPKEILEDRFVCRDCVDLVRSAITQKLHIDYMEACALLARWEQGRAEAQAVRDKWADCEKLLAAFAELLACHEDYSVYGTLQDQGKNRKVNPYFEEALKENILNNYCRTAAYELVQHVYLQESAAFGAWVGQCLTEKQGKPLPTEQFEAARSKIYAEYKVLPLKAMQPEAPCDLLSVLAKMLTIIK